MYKSRLLRSCEQSVVFLHTRVLIRRHQFPAFHLLSQHRPFLHTQRIRRQMFHRQVKGTLQVLPEIRRVLPGQAVDEVNAEIVYSACGQRSDCSLRLRCRVPAPQEAQQGVGESLYSQAHPVHSHPAPLRHPFGAHIVGIALQGNLRIVRHAEQLADGAHHFLQCHIGQQRRRAPAKVDGVECGRFAARSRQVVLPESQLVA